MYLDSRIRKIEDPIFFKRLFNLIHCAEFGKDFQVTKDLKDWGIDGYLKSRNEVFAVYCPEFPEKRIARDYKLKVKNDLKALRQAVKKKWVVKEWAFVTPEDLPVDVISFVDKETQNMNLTFETITASRLAVLLLKHRELHKDLPELHIGDHEEKFPNLYINLVNNRGYVMVEVFNNGNEDIQDLHTELLNEQARDLDNSYLYEHDTPSSGYIHTCHVLRKGERQYINNVPNQTDFTISFEGVGVESGEPYKLVKDLKKMIRMS